MRRRSRTRRVLNYGRVEASSRRIVTTVLLLFGPFAIVAILVFMEVCHARATGYSPTGRLSPFLRVALITELLLLLFSLANVPLMHWHLSVLRTYEHSRTWVKVTLASAAALGYLVALIAVFCLVFMMHSV